MLVPLVLVLLGAEARDRYPPDVVPTHERFIAIPTSGLDVHVLDMIEQRIVYSSTTPAWLEHVQVAPDGLSVASIDETGRLRIVVLADQGTTRELAVPPRPPHTSFLFAWSPTADHLAVLVRDHDLHIVDVRHMSLTTTAIDETPKVLAWSNDGLELAVGLEPPSVRLLHARTGAIRARIELPTARLDGLKNEVTALDFGPKDEFLAVGTTGCRVEVWRPAEPRLVSAFRLGPSSWDLPWFRLSSLEFSPDGTRLVGATNDLWAIEEWEWRGQERLLSLDWGGGNPFPLRPTYSADGARIFCAVPGLTFESGVQPAGMRTNFVCIPRLAHVPGDRFGIQQQPRGAAVVDLDSQKKLYSVVDGVIVR